MAGKLASEQRQTAAVETDVRPPIFDALKHLEGSVAPELEAIVDSRKARGQPVFLMDKSLVNTPPPPHAKALMEGSGCGKIPLWNVAPSAGLPELRQEVALWRTTLYRERITADNVLITPGACGAFSLCVQGLVNPSEGVLMMPPYFPNYLAILRCRGVEIKNAPLIADLGFQPAPGAIERLWTGNTRLGVVTLPNNPTGTVLKSDTIHQMEKYAEANNGRVILDETFAPLDIRADAQALTKLSLKRTLTLGTFSEAFSISDLRVGYLIGPANIISAMAAYQSIAGGASARWQSVALAALRQREEHFDRIVPKLRRRDAEVHNALESISGVEVVSGYAGTFKWVKFEAGNSKKFALDLARQTGVIVRPGADYGQDGWVRISFGMLESPADLAEALQRLQQFEGWRRAPKWDDDIKLPPRPPRRTARGVARDQHEEEAHPGSAAY